MEINAVCALPERKCGKFIPPQDDLYYVHRMYVNIPGQYNVVSSMKPQRNNYKRTYTEDFGTIMPLDSDESEIDLTANESMNEVGVDENYNVKYDQDDSSESTPPNRNLSLEVIEINDEEDKFDNRNSNTDAVSKDNDIIEIDDNENVAASSNLKDKVSE